MCLWYNGIKHKFYMKIPTNIPQNKLFRSAAVAGLALLIIAGTASAATTIGSNVDTEGTLTVDGNTTLGDDVNNDTLTVESTILGEDPLVFEGSVDDGNTVTLSAGNPGTDRTLILPDKTGTLATLGDTGGGIWEGGVNGYYADGDAVIVGGDVPETIDNAAFTLGSENLFVENSIGVENGIYSDGPIDIFNTDDASAMFIQSDSTTSVPAMELSVNGLVDNDGLVITNTNNALSSGSMVSVEHNANSIANAYDGPLFQINDDRTLNTANSYTDSGGTLVLDKQVTVDNPGANYTVDSKALSITYSGNESSGTLDTEDASSIDVQQFNIGKRASGITLFRNSGNGMVQGSGMQASYFVADGASHDGSAFTDAPGAGSVGGVIYQSSNNSSGDMFGSGGIFIAENNGPAVGTVDKAVGVAGTVFNVASGTMNQAASLKAYHKLNPAGGTIVDNYGLLVQDQTRGTNDYGVYVGGADTWSIWADADDVRFDENAIIGGSTSTSSTLSDGNFTLDGDDLFVAGDAGVEGSIYTDDTLIIGETSSPLSFEGGTVDGNETTISVTDPTTDRTLTLPDATGRVEVVSQNATISSAIDLTKAQMQSASYFPVDTSGGSVDIDVENSLDAIDVGRSLKFVVTSGGNGLTVTGGDSGTDDPTVVTLTGAGASVDAAGDYIECLVTATSSVTCTTWAQ